MPSSAGDMGCLPQLIPTSFVETESLTETEAFSLVTLGGKGSSCFYFPGVGVVGTHGCTQGFHVGADKSQLHGESFVN